MKWDITRDLILNNEICWKKFGEASSFAFHTKSWGTTLEKSLSRGKSKSRQSKSIFNRASLSCWNCRGRGHLRRDYWSSMKNNSVHEIANIARKANDALVLSINSPIEFSILDSSALLHPTSYCKIMKNYTSSDFKKVHLTNDNTLKIVGKRDFQVKFPNKIVWKLNNVRHIPRFKKNLISIG